MKERAIAGLGAKPLTSQLQLHMDGLAWALTDAGGTAIAGDGIYIRRPVARVSKGTRNKVVGKEFHFLKKVTSNGMKLKSNIKNYPNLMEKNIRYSYTYFNSKSRSLKDNVKRSLNGRLKKIARS